MYTGFLYEDVKQCLRNVDVLIDGTYVPAKNPGLGKAKWRGSTNQRVIDVQKSLAQNKVVEYVDFNGKTISENERDR
jgi:anaerobic ribonucleoside-triphosphate reductase activating protein